MTARIDGGTTHPPAPHGGTVDAGEASDAEARQAIVVELDGTLAVAAGAGTGKTTALVDRVLSLVTSGRVELSEVAAITFTEAAAAELRARLRSALQAAAAGQPWRPGAPEPAADPPVARRRAAAALAGFDAATVTTLHGFARTLLAAHPLAAGVPPVFTVYDEPAADAARDAEWAAALADLLGDPVWADTLQRATVVGIRLDQLRTLFDRLTGEGDRIEDTVADPAAVPRPRPPAAVDVAPVLVPLDEAVTLAAGCTDDGDILYRHVQSLRPWMERLRSAGDDLGRLAELQAVPSAVRCGRGQKGNWPGGTRPVRDLLDAADQARGGLVAQVGSQCLDDLGRWLAHRALLVAADRCRRGELTFHDLLVAARRLLRHDPAARRAVSRRFRVLLLDELQDTDPIQAELAVRIAAVGDPDPARPWTDLAVEPGRLFLVGDPKQAIYRFRRADIATVDDIHQVAGGRRLELTDNWRSVPGVLDWVNDVVGPLLGDGRPGVQAPYRALVPRRDPLGPEPPVLVLGGPDEERRSAAQRRQAAMAEVAAVVADAVGSWPVGDERRPLRPDDVCVLLPTRTPLAQLEAAFAEAGIDYRLDSGSLIYASPQVRDVLAVLRAVDDPADPAAVLGALRTPLLACGDDDLARFAAAGGTWDCRRPPPPDVPDDHPVALSLAELRALHDQRWWLDPAQLVDRVVEATAATVLALDERRWRDAWRRLRFLAAEARTFCDQVGGDLRGFLAWTERRADEHARTTDLDLPTADDGAVRVMTVHGAKGLEFPMVVVCGLDSPPSPRPSVDVLFGRVGPELRAGVHRTAGYDVLDAHERDSEAAELVRLLYVATTRARDHLVVALHHAPKTTCLAASLFERCQQAPSRWRTPDDPSPMATQGGPAAPVPAPGPPGVAGAPGVSTGPGLRGVSAGPGVPGVSTGPGVPAGPPAGQLRLPLDVDGHGATAAPSPQGAASPGGAAAPAGAASPAGVPSRGGAAAAGDDGFAVAGEQVRQRPGSAPSPVPPPVEADPLDEWPAIAAGRADVVAAVERRWDEEFEDRLAAARRPPVVAATSVASRMADEQARPARAGVRTEPGGPFAGDQADGAAGSTDDGTGDLAGDLADGTDDDGGGAPWRRRGRAATAVGRAVHAALHTVDLETGEDLADVARAAAAAEGIGDQHHQVARLAAAALASPVVRAAVAGGRWWREVYVGAVVAGRTVEGFVDLLVEHPDGLEVVDYKTDLLADEAAADAAVDRYRAQAAAYALALARTAPTRPVVRCSFVFLRGVTGGDAEVVTRSLTGDQLAAAVADVEAWLAADAG